MTQPLVSAHAACVWIPLFPLKCEEERRPDLAGRPLALLAPDGTRRVWQASAGARRAGVRAGMTVSQAIGACPSLLLREPDPVLYDERFAAILGTLGEVSPVVEAADLGIAYVGMDGLEGIYGDAARQMAAVRTCLAGRGARDAGAEHRGAPGPAARTVDTARLGWARGKFAAWVAATRARGRDAVIVPPGDEARFLAGQPLAVLPIDPDTRRRLHRLGLRTLGDVARLPEPALVSQFGRAGRRLWRLAAGRAAEPVVGRRDPEPVTAALTFFTPVGDHAMLLQAVTRLVTRALRDPRRTGWRVQVVRLRAALERGASWLAEVTLKDPTADAARIVAPLRTRLEQAPPAGAVERLAVEFVAFAPGTAELQLFARDAAAAARAGRRRALRAAAEEIRARFRRPLLYHVIEVQPWSRLPERRYALIVYEP